MNNLLIIIIVVLILIIAYLLWKISKLLQQQLGYEQTVYDSLKFALSPLFPKKN